MLTNGNVFGILTERSREPVRKPLDDGAKTKALCKLNNTKKTRNPDNNFEFEKYFSNSIEKPSLSLSKKI